jgi:hypothetical protein
MRRKILAGGTIDIKDKRLSTVCSREDSRQIRRRHAKGCTVLVGCITKVASSEVE